MGKQPYTDARKAANKRWDAANKDRYARLSLVIPAEAKPLIKAAAQAAGMSVNAWIYEAIREKL